VAAVTHIESWLLDSVASFYIAREEPDAVDKSRGGKRIRIVNSQVILYIRIEQMSVSSN
jgi:hypothetical protein